MRSALAFSLLLAPVAACNLSLASSGVPDDAAQITLPAESNEKLSDALGPYRHYSGYNERERLVIRTAPDWATAWDKVVALVMPKPPVPAVDFASDMVILAAMGTRPTGGYGIEITSVLGSQTGLYVRVRETSPGGNCGVTAALTAPVTAVIVPAFPGPVHFVEETARREC